MKRPGFTNTIKHVDECLKVFPPMPQVVDPSDYILFNKVEVDKGDYTAITYELRHKPTLIEQYKQAAMYE